MQKRDKKWSILIWSIFLSLIISLSFVYVSTKVNQNIRLNNFLDQFFYKWVNNNIWENEYLLADQKMYTVKNEESIIFLFSWTTTLTWTLKIKSWWPIYYEVKAFSWITENPLVYSWVISNINTTTFTGDLTSTYNKAELNIKNMWWLTTFSIDSNNNFTWTWVLQKYKIIKEIWWKSVEKTIFEK